MLVLSKQAQMVEQPVPVVGHLALAAAEGGDQGKFHGAGVGAVGCHVEEVCRKPGGREEEREGITLAHEEEGPDERDQALGEATAGDHEEFPEGGPENMAKLVDTQVEALDKVACLRIGEMTFPHPGAPEEDGKPRPPQPFAASGAAPKTEFVQ